VTGRLGRILPARLAENAAVFLAVGLSHRIAQLEDVASLRHVVSALDLAPVCAGAWVWGRMLENPFREIDSSASFWATGSLLAMAPPFQVNSNRGMS